MLYNLSNPLDVQNSRLQLEKLISEGCIIELKARRPPRTVRQNRYLHSCLAYFGALTGCEPEYVKTQYFKLLCNPDLFIITRSDRFRGEIKVLRSSAALTTEEMTLAIDRFRDWAAREGGIYIPSPQEHDQLLLMEAEIEKAKRYIADQYAT